jgi:dethiobiotin synthetase
MSPVVFVTGTDTGVGKTLVATALLRAARERGLRTIGLKPVAAGCESQQGRWTNADALALQGEASVPLDYADVNPVALRRPIAPHVAAAEQGMRLDAGSLAAHCRTVLAGQAADFAVIEGAGGWLVPLNDQETLADVCAALDCGVVLVVGMKLGCLNHALLTAAAIRDSGCELAGWVASCAGGPMAALEENLATLRAWLPAPCLGVLPDLGAAADAARAAPFLDILALAEVSRAGV